MTSRKYETKDQRNFMVVPAMNKSPMSNEKYNARCGFCHGADLNGIEGLGVTLKNSVFLQNMSKDETIEFLKAGRMPNSEDSISGGVMPGFNWLETSELVDIANFIKSNNE
jgi:cytochrome c553